MRTVSSHEVAADQQATSELPERVQEALGELAGAAKVPHIIRSRALAACLAGAYASVA